MGSHHSSLTPCLLIASRWGHFPFPPRSRPRGFHLKLIHFVLIASLTGHPPTSAVVASGASVDLKCSHEDDDVVVDRRKPSSEQKEEKD